MWEREWGDGLGLDMEHDTKICIGGNSKRKISR